MGTRTARPRPDAAITLTVMPDGKFTRAATQGGKTQQFAGPSAYGNGVLTLVQDSSPAPVGQLTWTDARHVHFRVAGDGPSDPGLNFTR